MRRAYASPPRAQPTAVTGERITTAADGFNPNWQRHVAAYALCGDLLPMGRTLDLGCGTGHSYELLAPRETVGVDLDPEVLVGQSRETHAADMRDLPFADASFTGVISVQSIEHVPDAERVLGEVSRILTPDGVAVFVTPNRLMLARPDEVVNPYHYVEYGPLELRSVCERFFPRVEIQGLFGSSRFLELATEQRQRVRRILRWDPLRLRRFISRGLRQRLNDRQLARSRAGNDPRAAAITREDFELRGSGIEESVDLVAICHQSSK